MPFVEWNADFNTGIREFDEHHHYLVNLLNKTYDDYICGAPDDEFGPILAALIEYAGYHFAAEDAWMRDHSYPQQAEHKEEHDGFIQKITQLHQEFQSGNINISLEVLTYLKTWLKHHILETDAAYGRFIRNTE